MMSGILLGVAMLVCSTGVSPAVETSPAAVVPVVFSFDLPDDAARPRRLAHPLLNEPSRIPWSGPVRNAQATTAKRHSKIDRIIAIAAGISIGWFAGGAIGYAVTPKRGPHDDTSGLKGVLIGAPIGAVAGGLTGYWLTK